MERARHVGRMISSEPENREGGFKVCDVGAAKNVTTGTHMAKVTGQRVTA